MLTDLEAENTALLQFLYACPTGLIEFAADGTVGMANPIAMQLLLPISGAPFVTNLFEALSSCAPDLRNLLDAFEPGHGTVCEGHRIFVGGGKGRATVLACTIVKMSAERYIATLGDISKQVVQERRLKEAETWFASLLDGIDDVAVMSLDEAGRIDAVTPSILRQTALAPENLIGLPLEAIERPDAVSSAPSVGEALVTAQRDGWHLYEGWHVHGTCERYWCQRLVTVRHDQDGEGGQLGYTVVLRAVTRQGRDATELRNLLTRDHLTGAGNRAHFFEMAERELARFRRYATGFAIVAMDIDHFKRINDTEGHAAGDAVLQELTRRCKAELRPQDTFARLGGEEFGILLPGGSLDEAVRIAERVRRVVSEVPFAFGGKGLSVTASFGCVAPETSGQALANLMASADEALYRAKHGGRDQVAIAGRNRAAA
ncbi:diguanylate cyclase [Methylobacterium sp. BTF04]|uniref:sensor domain-containing diguanylate cyclase n=1 Tax=Methylobacterium sp. BTF04 TaxID=2708300 RepID=UPI0013D5EA8A|nr:sensor domain-containing diguanylate cyclase [Methylobacterium sp. BTF04]NEU14623.1 diguanylate cyclase [Methylobacterium sp. BTF04]